MANRPKTERNLKILDYWQKGYRQIAIARMFKMKEAAVGMVILRERRRRVLLSDASKSKSRGV